MIDRDPAAMTRDGTSRREQTGMGMRDSGPAKALYRRAALVLVCAVGVLGATLSLALAAGPHAKLTPSDDLEFTAAVGASVHKTVKLKNDGDGALTLNVTEVVTSGPPFSVDNGCAAKQLAAGEECSMEVTFAPTAAVVVNGNLSITVSGAESPLPVSLQGTGTGGTTPPPPPPVAPPPPPPVVLPPPPPPPTPNDLDRDGVPDSIDACPLIAGSGANGCDGAGTGDDEDADGVKTSDDDCPTVAGNLANGCPSKLNAKIDGHWRVNSLYSQLVTFTVRAASGSRIELLCNGNNSGCGFKKRVIQKTTKTVTSLTRYFKGQRIIRAGVSIVVKVTRRLQVGTYERLLTRKGRKLPKVTEACLSAKTGAVGRCSS